jgi:predicted DNA-binding protein (MmcQ/YjbR family)
MIGMAEAAAIALAQPEATHVMLFGHTHVYKVRGRVFGILNEVDGLGFKASEIVYALLTEDGPGRRAPGFPPGRWVTMPLSEVAPDQAAEWLAASWRAVASGLPRKARAELGLAEGA